ncbi:MAG: response regulator transcription factor [Catenulispora sp.]|nr:response regulator transcription factor [Catenulispora sp.]
MTHILVVDDEPQLLRALRINLKTRGYDVDTVAAGVDALAEAARHLPDAILLDLGLPDMDGLDVIAGLRSWTNVPIVVLSGRTTQETKVEALDAGADDYVTKPFSMDELLARLRAVLRRHRDEEATAEPEATHHVGVSTVDLTARTVTREGQPVRLTRTEWTLLETLLRHPGQLITIPQLLTEVWGDTTDVASGHLRFHIARLRRKLEADTQHPTHLLTEHGVGYRYVPGPGKGLPHSQGTE